MSNREDIFTSTSEKNTPVDAESLSAAEDVVQQESTRTSRVKKLIREFVNMVVGKSTRRA